MTAKSPITLSKQRLSNLLGLLVCLSLVLTSIAATPLAPRGDGETPTVAPTEPVVTDQATPAASDTTEVAPTEAPTEVPPTDVLPTEAPTDVVPTDTPTEVAPTEVPPTPTEVAPTEVAPTPSAPVVNPEEANRVNFHQIVIKFKDVDGVRPDASGMAASATADLSTITAILQGQIVQRLFDAPVDELDADRAQAESLTHQPSADLNSYYLVQLAPDASYATAAAMLDALKKTGSLDTAYFEPIYKPAAPDYSGQQGYLLPYAPLPLPGTFGIDSVFARAQTGGDGYGIQLADIESGWQIGHEDLTIGNSSLVEDSVNSTTQSHIDHGTAVLGIIAAKDDGSGVTGIAPKTTIKLVSLFKEVGNTVQNRTLANAIIMATSHLVAGDIMLLPLEASVSVDPSPGQCPVACTCDNGFIPVEYPSANFNAIKAATDKGIIVIEAAGNSAINLDFKKSNGDYYYGDAFRRSERDSGAIIVGAGTKDTQEPTCNSNYGSRLDVQGWGEDVVTTGYGDLDNGGGDPNKYYTDSFGGTSAASAIVAGAAASLQGIAEKLRYTINPDDMRTVLVDTGTPQGGSIPIINKIGPLPNLQKAITQRLQLNLLSPTDGETVYTIRPTFDWTNYLNAKSYRLQVAIGCSFDDMVIDTTTSRSEYTPSKDMANGTTYCWKVTPYFDDGAHKGTSGIQFTIPAGVGPLNPPKLESPANKAVWTDPANTAFSWIEPNPVAEDYQIQASNTYDFLDSNPALGYDTVEPPAPVAGTSATLNLQPDQLYYWHVRSHSTVGGQDHFSAWTGRWIVYTTLPAPTLNPVDQTDQNLRPHFSWTAVTNATAYYLQVVLNSNSHTVLAATIKLPSGGTSIPTDYTLKSDLPRGQTLKWRVGVRGKYNVYNYSAWSAPFDTTSPPGVPHLVSPANKGVDNTFTPTYTWKKVKVPTGHTPANYHIQVSDASDFSNIVDEGTINNDVSYPAGATLDPQKIYYWRVQSIDGDDGTPGDWSGARILYTTPPAPTNLVAPVADSLRPIFSWDVVPTASSYWVQVGRDDPIDPFAHLYASYSAKSGLPFVLGVTLPANASTLHWRVRAGGLYGWSVWSDEGPTFDTLAAPPTLVSPSNGSTVMNFAPLFTWKKISTADSYDLQVDTDRFFGAPVIDTTSTTSIADIKYQTPIDAITTAGLYYWRVRANISGNPTAWSQPFSFYTPADVIGTVLDAETGDPLDGFSIVVHSGSTYGPSGPGAYKIHGLGPGQTVRLSASKAGYITQEFNVNLQKGKTSTLNFNLVSIPDAGTIKIVLTWEATPADLDAHLWVPKGSPSYHVGKIDSTTVNLGDTSTDPWASLNADVTTGYGPEIITLVDHDLGNGSNGLYPGTYTYVVHANSPNAAIIPSGAIVTVYDGPDINNVKIYKNPSGTSSNRWWQVFTLNGADRKITSINKVTSTFTYPYPDAP